MGIQDVGDLSLGQWSAIVRAWNAANGGKADAPSEDDFETAVLAARGVKV